jgi:hypothetical protein
MSIPEGCKPFDLERALAGDPVVTRDGKPVTQLTHFKDVANWRDSLCGVVDRSICSWQENGRYCPSAPYSKDLFMAPKKRTVWVNLYGDGFGFLYDTEAEADKASKDGDRIGNRAYPVEIEG